jgi:hypothetical protein
VHNHCTIPSPCNVLLLHCLKPASLQPVCSKGCLCRRPCTFCYTTCIHAHSPMAICTMLVIVKVCCLSQLLSPATTMYLQSRNWARCGTSQCQPLGVIAGSSIWLIDITAHAPLPSRCSRPDRVGGHQSILDVRVCLHKLLNLLLARVPAPQGASTHLDGWVVGNSPISSGCQTCCSQE